MGRPNEDNLVLLNPEALDHDLADLILRKMSWSRYDTYQWCPKQYYFKYVEFQKEGWSAPLCLGSAVHDALDGCVKNKVWPDKEFVIEGYYQSALMEHDPDHMLTQPEIDSGLDWLLLTLARMHDAVGEEYERVIDTEWGFKYIIGAGLFVGYLDLTFWDSDDKGKFIHIVDYKTGNNYTKQGRKKKHTKSHGQTKLYTLATKSRFPGERVKASLYWPQHEEWDTYEYSDAELRAFEKDMRFGVGEILVDTKWRPTPDGAKCTACTFAKSGACKWGAAQARKFGAMAKARKRKNAAA